MIAQAGNISISIREMHPDDLEQALGLSTQVKWPHRIQEWKRCLRLGFGFVAVAGGKVIGTAMGWPFADKFATLGMVIVSSDFRGRGLGKTLMEAVMEKLGDRTIILYSTKDGFPLYQKMGFEPFGMLSQHQGASYTAPLMAPNEIERVRPFGKNDIDDLIRLDAAAVGFERAGLIVDAVKSAQCVVLDQDNEIVGFSIFRRFGHGHVIGPTIAPTLSGAKLMISDWLRANPGMFVRMDIPGIDELSDWLEELGLTKVDQAIAMARGPLPELGGEAKLFSIVSQAFG